MPSLPCHQCGTVKRCQMVKTRGCDADNGAPASTKIEYLCRPCLRELGYVESAAR